MKPDDSILVVEDDADDQYFLARAFEEVPVPGRLEAVGDGQSAIQRLSAAGEGARPRLVLLDLNLPRKSGLEVLRWIRQDSACRTAIVIVLTSSTSEDDMRQAYSYGANAYVIKPADPTRLTDFARLVRDFWLGWNQNPPGPGRN